MVSDAQNFVSATGIEPGMSALHLRVPVSETLMLLSLEVLLDSWEQETEKHGHLFSFQATLSCLRGQIKNRVLSQTLKYFPVMHRAQTDVPYFHDYILRVTQNCVDPASQVQVIVVCG